jgi:sedoheptulose-bisphosphatase
MFRSPQDITKRLDGIIKQIRADFHSKVMGQPKDKNVPSDVLIVAHGHILRSFAARWINRSISVNPALILDAGGVGTLRCAFCYFLEPQANISSYEHQSIHEPALLLGGAFTVPEVEQAVNDGH